MCFVSFKSIYDNGLIIYIFEMGNKNTHDIPPMILKNWYQISPNQDIFKSKLTQQCVREHYYQIFSPSKIEELKQRMKEANPYICRVAFYYLHQNDFYYIYTDQNRNNPFVNNREEWRVHKERIVEAFIILARRYRPTNVCREMIGVDFSGQIKIWINPNPTENKVWSPCSTEAQMIKDVLKICDQIQEQSLKKQGPKRKISKNYKEQNLLLSTELLSKKRNNTQNFGGLQIREKNNSLKKVVVPNKFQTNNIQQKFRKTGQKKFNFKTINKAKDFTTPSTPQPIASSQLQCLPSWSNVKTEAFQEYYTTQNQNQQKKLQQPYANLAQKQLKKISKLKKFSSMNNINMELLGFEENDKKYNTLGKLSNSSRQQYKDRLNMAKKDKYLECRTQASENVSENQQKTYKNQMQLQSLIQMPPSSLKLSGSLQSPVLKKQKPLTKAEIESMFDEQEKRQYLQIQQKIKIRNIKYHDMKSQLAELLQNY